MVGEVCWFNIGRSMYNGLSHFEDVHVELLKVNGRSVF